MTNNLPKKKSNKNRKIRKKIKQCSRNLKNRAWKQMNEGFFLGPLISF